MPCQMNQWRSQEHPRMTSFLLDSLRSFPRPTQNVLCSRKRLQKKVTLKWSMLHIPLSLMMALCLNWTSWILPSFRKLCSIYGIKGISHVQASFNAGRRLLLSSTLDPFSTIHTSTILWSGRLTCEWCVVVPLPCCLPFILCSTIWSFFPLQKWKSRIPCHQLCFSCWSFATFCPFEWQNWQNRMWIGQWSCQSWGFIWTSLNKSMTKKMMPRLVTSGLSMMRLPMDMSKRWRTTWWTPSNSLSRITKPSNFAFLFIYRRPIGLTQRWLDQAPMTVILGTFLRMPEEGSEAPQRDCDGAWNLLLLHVVSLEERCPWECICGGDEGKLQVMQWAWKRWRWWQFSIQQERFDETCCWGVGFHQVRICCDECQVWWNC